MMRGVVVGLDERGAREALLPVPFFDPSRELAMEHDRIRVPVKSDFFINEFTSMALSANVFVQQNGGVKFTWRLRRLAVGDKNSRKPDALAAALGTARDKSSLMLLARLVYPHVRVAMVCDETYSLISRSRAILEEARAFSATDSLPTPAKQEGLAAIEVAHEEIIAFLEESSEYPAGLTSGLKARILAPYEEVLDAMANRLAAVKAAHEEQLSTFVDQAGAHAYSRAESVLSLLTAPVPS